ncbi:MAG: patatin-like phospholipase family protein [Bacteroidales bacterium]|nr:patatin-like phospholipase family protein [Bacteroidales bacterium]
MRRLAIIILSITLSTVSRSASAQTDSLSSDEGRRPKIGLVLSGGGARGAAHIGVIKALEDMGIRIDVITGTSMGAIVGGVYALGYSADELEQIVKDTDWPLLMSDNVPRRLQSTAVKEHQESYVLSIPWGRGGSSTKEKFRTMKKLSDIDNQNILNTLPAGFINGQNVLNLLQSLSVGYADSTDFSTLPIPFACVAADLITGREVELCSGFLPQAIRASMSIAGLFAPVKMGELLLADGGMANNFPVDLCRRLGADIVIGVDLSMEKNATADNSNSLPKVFRQMAALLNSNRPTPEKDCDICIKPSISKYSAMDFRKEAMEELIRIGYASADSLREQLMNIKAQNPQAPGLNAPRALNMARDSFSISEIVISGPGVSDKDLKWLENKSRLLKKKNVSGKDITDAIGILTGTGCYSTVSYSLKGETSPYRLEIEVTERQPHNFALSARYDTQEAIAAGLELGFNAHRMNAPRAELTARLGFHPWLDLKFSMAPYYAPRFGVHYRIRGIGFSHSSIDAPTTAEDRTTLYQSVDFFLSESHSRAVSTRFYVSYDFYRPWVAYNNAAGYRHAASLGLDFRTDTRDKAYFPHRGILLDIKGQWVFWQDEAIAEGAANSQLGSAKLLLDVPIPLGGKVTLEPSIGLRALFGPNSGFFQQNWIGGHIDSRFTPSQFAFYGQVLPVSTYKYTGVASLEIRGECLPNFYVQAMGSYGATFKDIRSPKDSWKNMWGVAAGLSYHSPLGPVSGFVEWSGITNTIGYYISLGYNF